MSNYQILPGDCLETMRQLPSGSVQTCVTSPPYYGLRNYNGGDAEIGLEESPDAYVSKLVEVFREVRRLLRDDGTLWLNLASSYNGSGGSTTTTNLGKQYDGSSGNFTCQPRNLSNFKPKDMIPIPWMVAMALQQDGYYLRQDIIWHKPNPMPESVTDRCTKAHEYIFLLSKSSSYFYDAEAIKEAQEGDGRKRGAYAHGPNVNQPVKNFVDNGKRNRRSVWTVATKPYGEAHFATFPPDLIEPCILAGSRPGDTVLDPFNGAATTGLVALKHGRKYIGCELNPDYIELSHKRLLGVASQQRLFDLHPAHAGGEAGGA